MITICPQCQLPLAVTATDLRVAQGQVRCGRCAAVFNALASLYEPDGPVAAPRPTAAPRAPAQPGGDAHAPGTEPDARDRRSSPASGVESTTVLDARSLRDPAATAGGAAGFGTGSGLFRAPPRDDEPRFDDTHGADDWPEDALPDSAAAAAVAPEAVTATPEAAVPARATAIPEVAIPAPATATGGPAGLATVPMPVPVSELESESESESGRTPPQPASTSAPADDAGDAAAAAAPRTTAAAATSTAATTSAAAGTPAAGLAEITDTFRREPEAPEPEAGTAAADQPPPDAALEPATDSLRLPAEGSLDAVAAVDGEASRDGAGGEPAPAQPAGRDWTIDTMMAAELAALVARAQRDEPPELASIRIAVDESSEITVLPSEAPASWSRAAADDPAATAEYAGDRSLPRLSQVSDDDPDSVGARREAAERRAAMPSGLALRWLELEPAPPQSTPLPVAPAASSTPQVSAGAEPAPRSPLLPGRPTTPSTPRQPAADEPAPRSTLPRATPTTPSTPRQPAGDEPMPVAADEQNTAPLRTPSASEDARPGAFAAALGLDADLTPRDVPVSAADAVVADLAAGGRSRTAATPRWMWAATVLLGLALTVQLAHLYREELAGVPSLQEPLTRLYAALGRPLQPRWELGRYELRQQGVVAEAVASGTLTVRASIRNGAGRAQPAPLLRVTLQDRFGNRVATRDLTPREYGGAAAIAPAPMLAPGQRIDAEVSLLDPGGEAVGFELDVCLRRADASIACASDAAGAAS